MTNSTHSASVRPSSCRGSVPAPSRWDEYDSKLGAIYAAQSIAEIESLVPWALAPQRQRSRVALFSICGGVAAAVVAITLVASMALKRPTPSCAVWATVPPSMPRVKPGPISATTQPTSVPNVTTLSTVAAAAPDVYGPPNGARQPW